MTARTFNAVMVAKADGPHGASLHHIRRMATHAADELVDKLRTLQPKEQKQLAEALIATLYPILKEGEKAVSKGNPEYNPDQARGNDGKWTAGGVARAVGGATLRTLQDAASTITLIPSSKTTAKEAISEWWARANSDKNIGPAGTSTDHVEAVSEFATRLFITVFVGAVMYALAHAFLTSAAGVVGQAVGQVLRSLMRGTP